MSRHIKAIGLDVFNTSLLKKVHYESPFKQLITTIYPRNQGAIVTALVPTILTEHISFSGLVAEAAIKGHFAENDKDIDEGIYAAELLLNAHHHPETYERNPQVDRVKDMASRYGMQIGLVTDLAWQFGDIVDDYFPDIETRVYSYDVGSTKRQGTPFEILADRLGVYPDEIVYVGENFTSDYIMPRNVGLESFWYVPNADTSTSPAVQTHRDDVVTDLGQIFNKMRERRYRLGE